MSDDNMKPVQGYLGIIEKSSLPVLIVCFLASYAALAFVFTVIYYFGGLFEGSSPFGVSLLSAFYFSIVTQSTLGYGDLTPVGAGVPLAVIQTCLGMVFFALGAGVVVLRDADSRQEVLFSSTSSLSSILNRGASDFE